MTSSERRRWLALGGAAIAATAAGAWFASRRLAPQLPADDVVNAFFASKFNDGTGQPVAMDSFRGRTLVLNFWATWCPPCIDEMPELSALQNDFTPVNAQVLGIGVDSAANIAEFARKTQIAYPVLVTGAAGVEWARRFGDLAGALPYTVVITSDGKIADTVLGRIQPEKLRKQVLQLARTQRN
jgi:peroxiredoxin